MARQSSGRESGTGTDRVEFLEREVYPRLFERLDAAFPEFGFQRRDGHRIASNEAHTRTLPGSPRPGRVYAYQNTPFAFVVQGGETISWVAYVTTGATPRGPQFVDAVRELAARAGAVLPEREPGRPERERAERQARRSDLLEAFLVLARRWLRSEAGRPARDGLARRGFTASTTEPGEFGFFPTRGEVREALLARGFSEEEVGFPARQVREGRPAGSGLLYDGRWEGRLIGPWRDRRGRIVNRWRGAEFIGLPQRTLRTLDEATLGFRGLMLLAAAPNVGKTALSVQWGLDVVAHNDDACFLFVSLEMPRWEILSRLKCSLAEMDWKTLVFGSQPQRGRGVEASYTREELERLRHAENRLAALGDRICILDESNFPEPTLEALIAELADLKARSGARRALVLVDYLQVWPIPAPAAGRLRSDLEADRWRIGAMKALRDATDEDAVLVISESRKPDPGGRAAWGGDLADVMGSARGSYTPDMVFLFRELGDRELQPVFDLGLNPSEEALQEAREAARLRGISYTRLTIAKGRDGVLRTELNLTFHYRQSRFEEGLVQ